MSTSITSKGIDPRKEKLIPVAKVPELDWLPQRWKANSIHRWAEAGCKSRGGIVVKLEYIRTPAGKMTSEAALLRFFERLDDITSVTLTPTQKRRNYEDACRHLQSAGIVASQPATA